MYSSVNILREVVVQESLHGFQNIYIDPDWITSLTLVCNVSNLYLSCDQVGIVAWKGAQDSTSLTPNDYACLRGYYCYI